MLLFFRFPVDQITRKKCNSEIWWTVEAPRVYQKKRKIWFVSSLRNQLDSGFPAERFFVVWREGEGALSVSFAPSPGCQHAFGAEKKTKTSAMAVKVPAKQDKQATNRLTWTFSLFIFCFVCVPVTK